eukprot:SAG31_NODE_2148_length_6333_cov_16.166667_4_plen_114_part_00
MIALYTFVLLVQGAGLTCIFQPAVPDPTIGAQNWMMVFNWIICVGRNVWLMVFIAKQHRKFGYRGSDFEPAGLTYNSLLGRASSIGLSVAYVLAPADRVFAFHLVADWLQDTS